MSKQARTHNTARRQDAVMDDVAQAAAPLEDCCLLANEMAADDGVTEVATENLSIHTTGIGEEDQTLRTDDVAQAAAPLEDCCLLANEMAADDGERR
ncbi:hypothetical protein H4Q26_001289 [Puccinia striiformis f. sp. tritici PST-130]|nr:hypothetical protein H4Q26_001289 [Puccinia striiformis f. sp. tritici PST-130]